MRILIAGSRAFCAGYRIDRALLRASKNQRNITVVTVGRIARRGADRTARSYADEFGWELDYCEHISQGEEPFDLCLAFLHTQDSPTEPGRITALKAEKAGIPVWRYYEGPATHRNEPEVPEADFDFFEEDAIADMQWRFRIAEDGGIVLEPGAA